MAEHLRQKEQLGLFDESTPQPEAVDAKSTTKLLIRQQIRRDMEALADPLLVRMPGCDDDFFRRRIQMLREWYKELEAS